jgi:exodeoxyribonuclease VII small subunit
MTNPDASEIRYEDAMAELEGILRAVEDGDVGLDELSEKVARAAVLIRTCQGRIRETEMSVQRVLDELDEAANGEAK